MQALALAFLAATAFGGLAWVFIYPLLSGEKKAELRRASIAKSEAGRAPGRQEPALAPRTGRRIAEGARGAQPEGKEGSAEQPPHAGRPELVTQKFMMVSGILAAACFAMAMLVGGGLLGATGLAFAAGFGLPRWGAELSQEAPRKRTFCGAAGRRRRDRARHQGGPAAV